MLPGGIMPSEKNRRGSLAAFACSTEAPRVFSMEEIPELLQPIMIDEPYWMGGDWPEPFRREQVSF